MKVNWLDRGLMYAPYMALCTHEEEFAAAKKHLKVDDPAEWPGTGRAKVRSYIKDGKLTCLVLVGDVSKNTPIEIVGLLTHEAVHVWQELCDHIGESRPSSEFEAYSIQTIAQCLWCAYVDQVIKVPAKPAARRPGARRKSRSA